MNTDTLKSLLDTCFTAKRIVETLPALPDGMKPRHIHVLDAIEEVSQKQGLCRVSDVSTRLNITMPSVTRLINELEQYGLVAKSADTADRRITLLSLTDSGLSCVRRHVHEFHAIWAEALSEVSDVQAQEAIFVIEKLRQTMPGLEEEKK